MKYVFPLLLAATALASTVVTAGAAHAVDNPWLVRGRIINVNPDVESFTSIGGRVDAKSDSVPEVDLTYFLTDHIAVEGIAATSKHKMSAKGTSSGDLDLGSVWVLPPTVTAQYHMTPMSVGAGTVKPYVGAGINYTVFYNEDRGAMNDVEYDASVGPALQAGVDWQPCANKPWVVNLDVKKLYIRTDARVNGAVEADVKLDPLVIGAGIGYRF